MTSQPALNILGINAYHADSAACLLRDGVLVAAAEEERFRRIKHWAGFPSQAIRYCLAEARMSLRDVDCIAVNRNDRANLARKIAYVLTGRPNPKLIIDRLRNRGRVASLEEELAKEFPSARFEGRVERIEHHLAHLASAFYVSPFAEAVAVSVDGFGDFASAAWGFGAGDDAVARRPGAVSAFARHLLSGDDAVSRVSALRRRVQADGACGLWRGRD